jgi:hypothetical protein
MNWHSRALVQMRLIGYSAALVLSIILGWLHLIPVVMAAVGVFFSGMFAYMERCPNCSHPYLLQRGKGVLNLGKTCGNCGVPIK